MTGRERLMTALRLDEPDGLPINIRGVRPWDEAWVASRDPSYGPVIEVVAEHGDYYERWAPPAGPFLSMTDAAATCHVQVDHPDWVETITTMDTPRGPLRARRLASKRGLPGLQTEFYVKTLEDVERALSVPYVPLVDIDPAVFLARERVMGDRGVTMVEIGPAPIMCVAELMGSERLAFWSLDERETILRLLSVFRERLLQRLDATLAAGVGPVFSTYGQEYATPPLHSPRDFHEFCVEPERAFLERVRAAGGLLWMHCHGPIDAILDSFPEIADALHPLEAPPLGNVVLTDAKRRVGQRLCLEGNIQIGDIYAMPTPKLVDMVKRVIDDAAPGGGFILAATASPHTQVLPEQAVRNYIALMETAVEYGRPSPHARRA